MDRLNIHSINQWIIIHRGLLIFDEKPRESGQTKTLITQEIIITPYHLIYSRRIPFINSAKFSTWKLSPGRTYYSNCRCLQACNYMFPFTPNYFPFLGTLRLTHQSILPHEQQGLSVGDFRTVWFYFNWVGIARQSSMNYVFTKCQSSNRKTELSWALSSNCCGVCIILGSM